MKMKIEELVKYFDSLQTPFPWGIYNLDKSEHLFDNSFIRRLFLKYASWCFNSIEDEKITIATDFFESWGNWCVSNFDSFKKLKTAWDSNYSAIENYDRIEEGSFTDEHHKGTRTSNNLNTKTIDKEKNKTTQSESAFNSGLTPVSETSGNSADNESEMTTTANATDNFTETRDISETVFDKDTRTFENYRVHGNIGVTTNAQMLTAEIEMRLNYLAKNIVKSFVKEFCYYVDSDF